MAQPTTNPKIDELRIKLRSDPKSRVFYQLAEELRKIGRNDEAFDILKAGLAVHPQYLAAWVSAGRVQRDRGRPAEAIEALQQALILDGGNVVTARLLADTFYGMGEKVEAIKKYKLVHALLPSDEDVKDRIDELNRELNPLLPHPGEVAAEGGVADDPFLPMPAAGAVDSADDVREALSSDLAPPAAPAAFSATGAEIPEARPEVPSSPAAHEEPEQLEPSTSVFEPAPSDVEPMQAPFARGDSLNENPFGAVDPQSAWAEPTEVEPPLQLPLPVHPEDVDNDHVGRSETNFFTPATGGEGTTEAVDLEGAAGMSIVSAPDEESPGDTSSDVFEEPADPLRSAYEEPAPEMESPHSGMRSPSDDQALWAADDTVPFGHSHGENSSHDGGESTASPFHDEAPEPELMLDGGIADSPPPDSALDEPTATMTMGDLYAGQGHREAARAIYEKIVAKDPQNAEARRKLELFGAAQESENSRRIRRLSSWLARVGRRDGPHV